MATVEILFTIVEERDAPLEPEIAFPSGDSFGDPIIISDSNGEMPVTFAGGTTETSEPLPTGVTKTVWLRWDTGPEDNPRVVFNSGLASIQIGTGSTVAGFTSLWSGEGSVAAYPDADSSYMVQVGWRTGDPDEVVLEWSSEDAPYYDEFATPYEMEGNMDRATLSTDFCTTQPSEPLPAGTETTAWSRWTPDTAGDAVIETSDPNIIINVYEDSDDITSLTLVVTGVGNVQFTASDTPYLVQLCDTTEPGA